MRVRLKKRLRFIGRWAVLTLKKLTQYFFRMTQGIYRWNIALLTILMIVLEIEVKNEQMGEGIYVQICPHKYSRKGQREAD